MDAQTCLKKMQLAGTLSLATVDENGAPQIRCVSAVHYESRAIYFLTARQGDGPPAYGRWARPNARPHAV